VFFSQEAGDIFFTVETILICVTPVGYCT